MLSLCDSASCLTVCVCVLNCLNAGVKMIPKCSSCSKVSTTKHRTEYNGISAEDPDCFAKALNKVRNTPSFWRHFIYRLLKLASLPRQARHTHRESTQNRGVFVQVQSFAAEANLPFLNTEYKDGLQSGKCLTREKPCPVVVLRSMNDTGVAAADSPRD